MTFTKRSAVVLVLAQFAFANVAKADSVIPAKDKIESCGEIRILKADEFLIVMQDVLNLNETKATSDPRAECLSACERTYNQAMAEPQRAYQAAIRVCQNAFRQTGPTQEAHNERNRCLAEAASALDAARKREREIADNCREQSCPDKTDPVALSNSREADFLLSALVDSQKINIEQIKRLFDDLTAPPTGCDDKDSNTK
jgi:hypothetical protein